MSNTETVHSVYEAFGRGDLPAILDHLGEDIEWEYGMADTGVPWLQPRRGRDGALGLLESLGENEVHIWHFDADGKVSRFCHKVDTYQHWAAFKGIDAGAAR